MDEGCRRGLLGAEAGLLLASQLQTVQRPGSDEDDVLRFGIESSATDVIRAAALELRILHRD
jgi:gluconate kinase